MAQFLWFTIIQSGNNSDNGLVSDINTVQLQNMYTRENKVYMLSQNSI